MKKQVHKGKSNLKAHKTQQKTNTECTLCRNLMQKELLKTAKA